MKLDRIVEAANGTPIEGAWPLKGSEPSGLIPSQRAGLIARRSAIGARSIACRLTGVMPMREDRTRSDKQQNGCANRNDQVDPKIPAVSLLRHECPWPTQGADYSS